ncbi:MAG TPA: CHAD domain-containing protein [Sphingomicrobium sp.]|nr:CHAD domain-containing protein [Sphingomicrobium sp.]
MNHEVELKVRRDSAGADPSAERALFRDSETALGLSDQPGKVARAELVPVRPEMIVAEAVEAVVQSCIHHFRSNEMIVAKRREAAALHQMRVSMRRLRAAFSLFRPALADAQFENLRQELRWFTGQLGEARNLDVFLARKGLPKPLRAAIKAEREHAYDQVIEALQSKRLRLLLIDLVAWIELGRWRQNPKACRPLPDFVARRLYKWWQKLARHGDLKSMDADERHELRIEIKKLRYALDFVQALHTSAGRKQKQFYKSVERLQESLGKLNDLVTMRALWRKFGHKLPRSRSEEHEVEEKCLRAAQASLDRLRKIGPYWTRLA